MHRSILTVTSIFASVRLSVIFVLMVYVRNGFSLQKLGSNILWDFYFVFQITISA